jgi:DNA-directed RNA polymerase specialized sigma24 family protein
MLHAEFTESYLKSRPIDRVKPRLGAGISLIYDSSGKKKRQTKPALSKTTNVSDGSRRPVSLAVARIESTCFLYDESRPQTAELLECSTSLTLDHGRRGETVQASHAAIGYDSSTAQRTSVPATPWASLTFARANYVVLNVTPAAEWAAAIVVPAAARVLPRSDQAATESSCGATSPHGTLRDAPPEFDYAAARRERRRRANADFVAEIRGLLANPAAVPNDYANLVVLHEASRAVLMRSCRAAAENGCGPKPTAAELAQEAYVMLCKLFGDKGPGPWIAKHNDHLPGWLFGVIANVCHEAHREHCRRERPWGTIGKLVRNDVDVAEVALAAESPGEPLGLDAYIAMLSTVKHVIYTRHCRDGLSLKEIAGELGRSYSTVKREFAGLKREVQRELERRQTGQAWGWP